MARDDDFTPKLGRIRDRGKRSDQRFSKQVRSAARGLAKPGRRQRFSGHLNGSGNAVGRRAQFQRARWQAFRSRRVTAKVYIARAGKGGSISAFRAHLKYIQRDGVERDGSGGELYSAKDREPDISGFAGRSADDRHQFRIILSAEDGPELGDLRETTRSLMTQMERDLGTRLDWVAVDHHNTGHPHTHIVVRGKDAKGKDLVIAPDYIKSGIRSRAQDIVTEELGPRRDIEIARSRYAEIQRDRYTSIDRSLDQSAEDGLVSFENTPRREQDRFQANLQKQRLAHLESLNLAAEIGPEEWQLAEDWTDTLRSLGKRGDIIRTLTSKFGREDGHERLEIWPIPGKDAGKLIGSVWKDIPGDELRGTRALIVEDFHGRKWFIGANFSETGTIPPNGSVVEITQTVPEPRSSDRTIAEIAARHRGVYSEAAHKAHDPGSSSAYRHAHTRRLEALRRKGIVERKTDAGWKIPRNYLALAEKYEASRSHNLKINVRSWISLDAQITRSASSWIDRVSPADDQPILQSAKARRQKWLQEKGLLEKGQTQLSDENLRNLRQQEISETEARLEQKTGRVVASLETGARFKGTFEGIQDLAQGRFAVIGNSKEFTLVPWRASIERQRGRELAVTRTQSGLSWTIGAQRHRGLER